MDKTTAAATPSPMSALARYDQAEAHFSPTGAHWAWIGVQLRAEAETLTGDMRRKRLDRATDCDHRAAGRPA